MEAIEGLFSTECTMAKSKQDGMDHPSCTEKVLTDIMVEPITSKNSFRRDSLILEIYIAFLQGNNSEVLPTQLRLKKTVLRLQ